MRTSVVVETVTAREHGAPVTRALGPVLDALAAQRAPADEIVVVLVAGEEALADELARSHPVSIAFAPFAGYFAMKNAGARAATGDVIVLCDGDTVPEADWLAAHLGAMGSGVDVTAGRTVYDGDGPLLASLSHAGFGIVDDGGGRAENVVINNIAYRRAVLLAHPFEERIRRDGGCYLQHHAMRRSGVHVRYVPAAVVRHEPERRLGWVRKHYHRGVDGVQVYRLDRDGLLRGSRWVARFGAAALPPIMARRLAVDLQRLRRARQRGAIDARMVLPTAMTLAGLRSVELAGGVVAAVRRR